MKALGIALASALALHCGSARAMEYERAFDGRKIDAVQLRIGAGKATVLPGKKPVVRARYVRFDQRHCEFAAEVKGRTLVVESRMNTKRMILTPCEVAVELTLPPSLKLRKMDVAAGSGTLDVRGLNVPLQVELGSGEGRVEGRFPSVKASIGSGSLDLVYPKGKRPGFKSRLEALIGSGALEIRAPHETRVFSELKGADFTNNARRARNRASADLLVSGTLGSGALTVEAN